MTWPLLRMDGFYHPYERRPAISTHGRQGCRLEGVDDPVDYLGRAFWGGGLGHQGVEDVPVVLDLGGPGGVNAGLAAFQEGHVEQVLLAEADQGERVVGLDAVADAQRGDLDGDVGAPAELDDVLQLGAHRHDVADAMPEG